MPSNLVYHIGADNAGAAAHGRSACAPRLKATSLLLTLYGDALAPRASAPVALSALIGLADALGLSARHVRTSVQRLTQADWLQAHRVGRCSFYAGSATGARRIAQGEQRIFSTSADASGERARWHFLVLGTQLRASTRQALARELAWCGFGEIAPGVFALHGPHPTVDVAPLLAAHGACEQVWTLLDVDRGSGPVHPDASVLRPEGHCAQRLLDGWHGFVERHRPCAGLLQDSDEMQAFVMRTQLVHDYRRLLQCHPELPFALCADMQQARQSAQHLFAIRYLALLEASERYLDRHLPRPDHSGIALLQNRVSAMQAWCAPLRA